MSQGVTMPPMRPVDVAVRQEAEPQIGETVFTVHGESELESAVTSDFLADPPSLIEHTCSPQELRCWRHGCLPRSCLHNRPWRWARSTG